MKNLSKSNTKQNKFRFIFFVEMQPILSTFPYNASIMRLYHEEIKYSITLHNSITIRTHISITDYSIQNYCYAVMLCNASINIQTYDSHIV